MVPPRGEKPAAAIAVHVRCAPNIDSEAAVAQHYKRNLYCQDQL